MSEAPVEDGFTAQHLADPPLVYIWIPVGIVGVILFVCLVRKYGKHRNKGARPLGPGRPRFFARAPCVACTLKQRWTLLLSCVGGRVRDRHATRLLRFR